MDEKPLFHQCRSNYHYIQLQRRLGRSSSSNKNTHICKMQHNLVSTQKKLCKGHTIIVFDEQTRKNFTWNAALTLFSLHKDAVQQRQDNSVEAEKADYRDDYLFLAISLDTSP